jgi:peptidoglycan hydrolase-like protein with peptidoglycan-binding domain
LRDLDDVVDFGTCRACGVVTAPGPAGSVTAPAPADPPAPKPVPLPLVQKGASGELVEAIQYLLRQGGAKDIVIDGDFGDQTDAAVRDFQKRKNLAQDGKVGTQTWSKLWVTVKRGAPQKDAVNAVQVLLNWQGKDVAIDGDFGDQTDGAVRAFQGDRKLTVDGVAGPATWTALVAK